MFFPGGPDIINLLKEKNYEKTDYFRYACLRDDLQCVLVNGMRD